MYSYFQYTHTHICETGRPFNRHKTKLNAISSQDAPLAADLRVGGGWAAGEGVSQTARQLRHNSARTYNQTIAIIINRYTFNDRVCRAQRPNVSWTSAGARDYGVYVIAAFVWYLSVRAGECIVSGWEFVERRRGRRDGAGATFLRSELAEPMICGAVSVHLAARRDAEHNSSEQRQISMSCDMKAMCHSACDTKCLHLTSRFDVRAPRTRVNGRRNSQVEIPQTGSKEDKIRNTEKFRLYRLAHAGILDNTNNVYCMGIKSRK